MNGRVWSAGQSAAPTYTPADTTVTQVRQTALVLIDRKKSDKNRPDYIPVISAKGRRHPIMMKHDQKS